MKIGDLSVQEIVINKVENNTFFALIKLLNKDGVQISIDSRPSDAIALAVREGIPIFVTSEVYEKTAHALFQENQDLQELTTYPEPEEFREFVNNISPEDFARYAHEHFKIWKTKKPKNNIYSKW